jgi:hypothetical protein
MHAVGYEHTGRQRSKAASVEHTGLLFQPQRDALLVGEGSRRAELEDPNGLGTSIRGCHQMPVHLVNRESKRFSHTEATVSDEHRPVSCGCPGGETWLDLHGHFEPGRLREAAHELAN